MRFRWNSTILVLSAVGFLVGAGFARAQIDQIGEPSNPDFVPVDAYRHWCLDGIRINKEVKFQIIVDTEGGTTSEYKFWYSTGWQSALMMVLPNKRGSYGFPTLRSMPKAYAPIYYLHDPSVTGDCYRQDIDVNRYAYWLGSPIYKGRPKKADDSPYQLINHKQQSATTQTEHWCMWKETWNWNWTVLLESELMFCWSVQVT